MRSETYVTILYFTPGMKILKRNINICLSDKVSQGIPMTPENIWLSDKVSQGVPMTLENICLLGKVSLDDPK